MLVFVSDNNNLRSANNEEKQSFQLSDILAVLRISTTWYCSMVIFGVFTIYAILSYSTNYLTEMYGMSLVAASYMGIVINKSSARCAAHLAALSPPTV